MKGETYIREIPFGGQLFNKPHIRSGHCLMDPEVDDVPPPLKAPLV